MANRRFEQNAASYNHPDALGVCSYATRRTESCRGEATLHPLHLAVAEALASRLPEHAELLRDPACGGSIQLPLFVGDRKGRDTRICCVDLLVLADGQVSAILEIEESGFLPTKICGKFLQAAIATHFIHDSRSEPAAAFADGVLFVQVLDASKCLVNGTRKDAQADLVAAEIRRRLPLTDSAIDDYRLYFIDGADDDARLDALAEVVSRALA